MNLFSTAKYIILKLVPIIFLHQVHSVVLLTVANRHVDKLPFYETTLIA